MASPGFLGGGLQSEYLRLLQAQMAGEGAPPPLLSVKCGRMTHHEVNKPEGKYKVTGDRRKGRIQLSKVSLFLFFILILTSFIFFFAPISYISHFLYRM